MSLATSPPAVLIPFNKSETMEDTSVSPMSWRSTVDRYVQLNDEQSAAYTADDENDEDGMASTSSSSCRSSPISMLDEDVDDSDDEIPRTITIPSTIEVSRTVSDDDESDLANVETSSRRDFQVFEIFSNSPVLMLNDDEGKPDLSWTTASINTPDFLLEERMTCLWNLYL